MGIAMERSVEMVVGVLGILKAGGAYVPLDVEYPKERLRYMLEDTGVKVLLSQQRLAGSLPECGDEVDVVCVDEEHSEREKIARRERRRSGEWSGSGESGVCDVHVGVDGDSERDWGAASGGGAAGAEQSLRGVGK